MANITLSTSVSVCEDTSESFDLKDLIQQAGGTAGGSPLILQIYVQDGSGNYIPAPAGSFWSRPIPTPSRSTWRVCRISTAISRFAFSVPTALVIW